MQISNERKLEKAFKTGKLFSYGFATAALGSLSISVYYFERMRLVSDSNIFLQIQGIHAVESFDFWAPLTVLFFFIFTLVSEFPKKIRRFPPIVLLSASSIILGLTFLLDYAGNTCVTPLSSSLMSFFFDNQTIAGAILLLPTGNRLTSFSNALFWFILLELAFLKIRYAKRKEFFPAFLDSVQFGSSVLALFALGIYLIDPTWRFQPVSTSWQNGTVLQFFTNFDLLLVSSLLFTTLVLVKFVRWRWLSGGPILAK